MKLAEAPCGIWLMLIHVPLCEMFDLLESSHILRCIILKADLILVETSSQVFKKINVHEPDAL